MTNPATLYRMNAKGLLYSLITASAAMTMCSNGVMAADDQGLYQTLHFISCEAYVKDRKEPVNTGMNAVDTIYVSGWLSGYNYLTPNTYDIIPNHNINMVMSWLDNFCKNNPQKNIEAGLLNLTDDLYPNRMKSYKTSGQAPAASKQTSKKK